jgi:hypothetical protein
MAGEEPDVPFDPNGFADSWWTHQYRRSAFEDHLLYLGDEGFDFEKTWTDDYDSSVELGGVPPAVRLNETQQQFLFDCGFQIAFVNHSDGVETHYSLKNPSLGWRRKRTEKGFVISYWPEGWKGGACDKWIETGYMTVDPNL